MARYLDDGEGTLVNQPANQVAKIAAVGTSLATNLGNSATGTEIATAVNAGATATNLNATRINSIITALVAAGIMKSS